MNIVINDYYANDHTNANGVIETNILHVVNVRSNSFAEIEAVFYQSETILLLDGKLSESNFSTVHLNDWLGEFFERKATEDEIKLFNSQKLKQAEFPHWAEIVCGDNYIK